MELQSLEKVHATVSSPAGSETSVSFVLTQDAAATACP